MFTQTTMITTLITSFIRIPSNMHLVELTKIDEEQERNTLTMTKKENIAKKNKNGSFISNVLVPLLNKVDVCIFLSIIIHLENVF